VAEVLTNIEELRNRIDVIDEQLVRLLNVRVACAVEVGRLKHEAGLPIFQPERETQVLNSVRRSAGELAGPLNFRTGHRRGAAGRTGRERSWRRSRTLARRMTGYRKRGEQEAEKTS
jgi:chorismate mutase